MITFSSVPAGAAASGVYVEQQNVKRGTGAAIIPRKSLLIGPVNDDDDFKPEFNKPQLIISKADAYERYGRGSILASMLEMFLDNKGGSDVYALPVEGGTVANTWEIKVSKTTATAAGVVTVYIAGVKVQVGVEKDETSEAIAAKLYEAINALNLPVVAKVPADSGDWTVIAVECRAKGQIGGQIDISANLGGEETAAGITVEITDNANGQGNPPIVDALENSKEKWFTEIVCPYIDKDSLRALEAHGDNVNSAETMKQFAGFVGFTGTIKEFSKKLESRNSQWTTFIPVPGTITPAYMLAAAGAAVFTALNSAEPGRTVKNVKLPGVLAGNQDMANNKDLIVKSGGSWTINLDDGTVFIGDLVTTKTADGKTPVDDWRFTEIIANLQFKIYSTAVRFSKPPYNRAVVVADAAGSVPEYAVRPSRVAMDAEGLVRDWESRGLTADADTVAAGIRAEIDASNPGRINLSIPDIPAAGLRILAAKIEWDFLV